MSGVDEQSSARRVLVVLLRPSGKDDKLLVAITVPRQQQEVKAGDGQVTY